MYLTLYFGLHLEERAYPHGQPTETGVYYIGPQGLLHLLESNWGLGGTPNTIDYLRIAQYRQALQQYLNKYPEAFFKNSFEADQLATTEELLGRRDALLLAGWDFLIKEKMPARLRELAVIEKELSQLSSPFIAGFADRFQAVLEAAETEENPVRHIYLNEPLDLLPIHLQRLFQILVQNGATLEQLPAEAPDNTTDLAYFQQALTGKVEKKKADRDGSLLLIKAKRETDAAAFLARLLRLNPDYAPVCVIPEKNRALDNAFIQEGLPSLGIQSASLARPTLQIIRLATVFLWKPIDPYKILEFVTLPMKPLEPDLAIIIARQIAQRPGLNSDNWFAAISQYFRELDARAVHDKSLNPQKIREEYSFWFERKRYDITKSVPKSEVVQIFGFLSRWASKKFEQEGSANSSLLVLSEQSRRIKELMEALPESFNFLNNLELERIIRTIYQPSPVVFREAEVAHLPYVYQSGAIIQPVSDLLWWNFSLREYPSFFSKWYQHETDFLYQHEVFPENPEKENQRLVWQRKRPVLQTRDRLILVIPERVEGKEVLSHPLLSDLEATFDNLDAITFDLARRQNADLLEAFFTLPEWMPLSRQIISQPQPMVELPDTRLFDEREHETFTSLDSLFYYPYQWVFRHKVRLHKSSILSVVADRTLMGNLAHRFIELMLKEDITNWSRQEVSDWINEQAPRLFAREASTLLMYGREPERLSFLNTLHFAAWSLVTHIQENNWQVLATEQDLQGYLLEVAVKGKADLVLVRGEERAIVDFKWRGRNWRQQTIKNEEDLQLVLYSKLVEPQPEWAHTAYFILEKGEMLARNQAAFCNCQAIDPDCNHRDTNDRIWQKMEKTLAWRLQQLQQGKIEIRTRQTAEDLEDLYAGELMELLEMKAENAPFDDYQVLIGLVR